MTALLELRQKISEVYGRYEAYVRICTKCLLAFLVFYMIHSQLSGSMNPRSWAEIVVATLIAVMIPIDACSILVAIFVIVHMLMISVEAGVTAVAFFLFLLLTYFIFKPRQSVLITVMCLAGMLNLTGAAAIPIGLLCGPIAVIPAAAGTFVYGMILTLRQNSSVLEASAQRLTSMEKAAYFIKAIGSNERILLLMAALVVTIVVVYMIRKASIFIRMGNCNRSRNSMLCSDCPSRQCSIWCNCSFAVSKYFYYTWCSYFECYSCVSLFVRWNAYRIS